MGSNQKSTGVGAGVVTLRRYSGATQGVCQDDAVSENVTRAEAAERSQLISVDGYDVDLDLTTGEQHFASTMTVAFRSQQAGASTWIDLIAPEVLSVNLNGRELVPDDVFDGNRIRLDDLEP